MIAWMFIFAAVLATSYLLALRSMRDFQEIPGEDENYSLFLIRNLDELTIATLETLHDNFLKSGQIIGFERLFKGHQSALVIFGPARLYGAFRNLDLLELEDYTKLSAGHVAVWEIGIKKSSTWTGIFTKFPPLAHTEQIWWQVLLSARFKPQIRAAVISADADRRHSLQTSMEGLSASGLAAIPRGFSNARLLRFYQMRSFRKSNRNPYLTPGQALSLIKI